VGEVVQFVPKSELERARLISDARAIYESIFPTLTRGTCPARVGIISAFFSDASYSAPLMAAANPLP
jgi:hypothetical protein